MDVYRQAADIVAQVSNGRGTAQSLCLAKNVQKKKATYAVVCETLKRLPLFQAALESCQFWDYYPKLRREEMLVCVMCHDLCFGGGVKTRGSDAAIAVAQSQSYIMESVRELQPKFVSSLHSSEQPHNSNNHVHGLNREGNHLFENNNIMLTVGVKATHRKDHHHRMLSAAVGVGEEVHSRNEEDGSTVPLSSASIFSSFPTYVRVNTMKCTVETAMAYFQRALSSSSGADSVRLDQHVRNLLVLPPNTALHKSRLVKSGAVLVQDKASCLPAAILLDDLVSASSTNSHPAATTTARSSTHPPSTNTAASPPPIRKVLDACSAPGNKTSQLVAILSSKLPPSQIITVTSETTDAEGGDVVSGGNKKGQTTKSRGQPPHHPSGTSSNSSRGSSEYTVFAVERDPKRFQLLSSRMKLLCPSALLSSQHDEDKNPSEKGEATTTNVVQLQLLTGDFLKFSDGVGAAGENKQLQEEKVPPEDEDDGQGNNGATEEEEEGYQQALGPIDAILLDPSCSASGMLRRVDVQLRRGSTTDNSHLTHRNHATHDDNARQQETEALVNDDDDHDHHKKRHRTEQVNQAVISNFVEKEAEEGEPTHRRSHPSENQHQQRIESLAAMQLQLLLHALLNFSSSVRRVVYSTCSIHYEENEGVVAAALKDERVQALGWKLFNIMPNTWSTRGWQQRPSSTVATVGDDDDDEDAHHTVGKKNSKKNNSKKKQCAKEQGEEEEKEGLEEDDARLNLQYCIRCDPYRDATNGFFVARFDRQIGMEN